ncbi:hypothetical protein [Micromonospora aurantiaca (nom. illeg.)]|uniref:hypothetical protein n=1 Tax=Micromonospora aurantiaca (nom. illeg.) TaxID=47850 RepID=UPI0035B32D06
MIGPVQLLMIGFKGPQPPDEVRKELDHLLVDHNHVRVIDMLTLVMHRNRTVERQQARDLLPALPADSGNLVDRLLRGAGAAAVMGDSTSGGAGFLFRGDKIPQLRQHMQPGTGAVILLLEHLWAVPLRDAVAESDAFPVTDAWIGRTALQDLNLMPSTTSSAAGHAAR